MEDLKHQMKDNFLKYASYVILDRAIPNIVDGLKPVQRRILYILMMMHDGKLHKVANVAGQTMALHPHGDAPITDALVNLANKGYLLDTQGNFGNILTGDPAAASRYIETRLSPLSKETLFNPDLTEFLPSYDGRAKEPVVLPSKIPVLLMQGAEGIAVGMSTRVLPHNFIELLEAQISILEGKEFMLLPDFYTGGIMDASEYDKGRGKVKLRARMEMPDQKTIIIREICHGTTTESLIRSIDEAAKRGKIKIDSINDYTADKVEIEIKLPRGVYVQDLQEALYAYTECEVSLNSQVVVIKDDLPIETTVDEILIHNTARLKEYLQRELEIERDRLNDKIFQKSLEQIFIENRLYKKIENVKSYEKVHETIEESLKPYHKHLLRVPTYEDRERLLNIPIRRISRFDIDKNEEEIVAIEKKLAQVEKDLKNIKKFTINYLKDLIDKYAKSYPRHTEIKEIEQLDRRAIETKQIKVGFDPKTGFVGSKVVSDIFIECTNFDKLLLIFKDGTYKVSNIPEKEYVHHDNSKVVYVGVADKETIINVVYKDPKSNYCFAKRFIVKKFILDKIYNYLEKGVDLEYISTDSNISLELVFVPKAKQKIAKGIFDMETVLVKGVSAKGIRMANRQVKKVKVIKK
ncbi:MAG: DNA topoisomerase IV subunit A [Chlamydiales bacterium]|nr:DNA topoisomerase IV subunit A [Chlamydiia bacterium]MCP5506966.1 DNA topoisomerase IV subunit A [Chlamydiales bacterium]